MRRKPAGISIIVIMLVVAGCSATQTPLLKSIHEGNTAEVKRLIDGGASIGEMGGCNPKDFFETTPLCCAIEENRIEILKLLLARGADTRQINNFGSTPLSSAAGRGNVEIVTLLLDKGADVNAGGYGFRAGWTPLMEAAAAGRADVIRLLLARGANIDARNQHGWSALGIAAYNKETQAAKILISKGADVDHAISMAERDAANAKKPEKDSSAAAMLRELRETVKRCTIKYRRDESEEAAFRESAARYRSLPAKPELPEEAREFRVRAEYAIGQKQFQEAVDLYGRALKISPWWPEGHFNQALILGEMGCPEEAIAAMNRYIALVPDAPDIRAARDRVYQWKGMIP